MREICLSGLTRGGAVAVIGLCASHPVAPLLLYWSNFFFFRCSEPALSLSNGVLVQC